MKTALSPLTTVAALAALLGLTTPASAVTQYWDVNGAAAGFGGAGTWNVGTEPTRASSRFR